MIYLYKFYVRIVERKNKYKKVRYEYIIAENEDKAIKKVKKQYPYFIDCMIFERYTYLRIGE